MLARRTTLLGAALSLALAALASTPAAAQDVGIKGLLGQASDHALDKLSQPGAFSADDAIRIALPGLGKGAGDLLKLAGKAGIGGGDLEGSLNRAAEQAAAKAKPIFRTAIDKATLSDGLSALKSETGGTDYLKKSAGDEIKAQILPLVQAALEAAGAFKYTSQLSSIGMSNDKLTDYVSGKTTDGIFTYVGREEADLRKNPLESGKKLLNGMKGLKF